jgi:hypothetical protein
MKQQLKPWLLFFQLQVGLYQECVEAYEVVLGDGSVVRATRDNEYSDLYHCLPWSHGTLGKILELPDLGNLQEWLPNFW